MDKSSERLHNRAEWAIWLFYAQALAVTTYAVISFVLPAHVDYLSEAAHIAALHAILFLVVVILFGMASRSMAADADKLSEFFPLTAVLADCPIGFVTLGNAVLLPILGVEAWLRDEMGTHFSVLLMVQMLAAVEVAATTVLALVVTWRVIQYRKVRGHSSGTAALPKPKRERGMSFAYSPSSGALLGGGSSANEYGLGYAREQSSALLAGEALEGTMERTSFTTPAKALRGMMPVDAPGTEAVSRGRPTPGGAYTPGDAVVGGSGGGQPFMSPAAVGHVPLGGGGLPFAAPAQVNKLMERIGELAARETELGARVAQLTRELESGARGTASEELAAMLSSATEDASALRLANRGLGARCDALEERLAYYESELRRATADTTRLRANLKEEKRKSEKLFASLDVEKEANAAAQVAIQDLKARLANYTGGGGGGGYVPQAAASAAGSMGGSTSNAAITEALQRSASRSFVYSPATVVAAASAATTAQQPLHSLLASPPPLARGSFGNVSQRQLLATAQRQQRERDAQQQQTSGNAMFTPGR